MIQTQAAGYEAKYIAYLYHLTDSGAGRTPVNRMKLQHQIKYCCKPYPAEHALAHNIWLELNTRCMPDLHTLSICPGGCYAHWQNSTRSEPMNLNQVGAKEE